MTKVATTSETAIVLGVTFTLMLIGAGISYAAGTDPFALVVDVFTLVADVMRQIAWTVQDAVLQWLTS